MRIYIDGVFDLTHYGHYELFHKVKQLYPNSYIIVGVCSDADCNKYKRKPILTMNERIRNIEACKWVNIVMGNVPWVLTPEFLQEHQIDYVAHDGQAYPMNAIDDVYGWIKKQNKFIPIEREYGISTTDIIHRILFNQTSDYQ